MSYFRLLAVRLEDGNATLECSECGPLGVAPAEEAQGLLFKHAVTTHRTGVPA